MSKIIVFILINLHFCISYPKNSYELEKVEAKYDTKGKTIRVGVLQDLRTGENIDKSLMAFIPLVLSGNIELDFPESDRFSMGTPVKYYFSDLIKLEMNNSYKLNNIYISEGNDSKVDYTINGHLSRFHCERKMYFYGLSFFGPLLWYFGLPAIINECEISIEFKILDKNETVIFTKDYNLAESVSSGLYYNLMDQNKVYLRILKNLLKKFMKDSEIVLKK